MQTLHIQTYSLDNGKKLYLFKSQLFSLEINWEATKFLVVVKSFPKF